MTETISQEPEKNGNYTIRVDPDTKTILEEIVLLFGLGTNVTALRNSVRVGYVIAKRNREEFLTLLNGNA